MPRIAPTSVVAGEYWLALRRYLGVPMAPAAPHGSMTHMVLQLMAAAMSILAEPSAAKIRWFRKIFGNFGPNFREWVAKTKNYKLKTRPEDV
jgi:hypothetical protein